MAQGNSGIIGAKRSPTISTATGVWSLSDAQRERGANNWPSGLPYRTNLRLHVDASQTNTITSSSGLVSQWNDLSGNNFDLTSTSTFRPTTGANTKNGFNVLTFGSNQSLRRYPTQIAAPAFTIFVVLKLPDTTTRFQILGIGNSTGPGCCLSYTQLETNTFSTVGQRFGMYTPNSSWDTSIATTTNWVVITWSSPAIVGQSISTTTTYRVTGVAGTFSARSVDQANWIDLSTKPGVKIGGGDSDLDGGNSNGIQIGEVVMYNEATSLQNIELVEAFLRNKWAI
jgi:hypothetical protein